MPLNPFQGLFLEFVPFHVSTLLKVESRPPLLCLINMIGDARFYTFADDNTLHLSQ